MALNKYSIYDIRHRVRKLKCCFVDKVSALIDKQKYGKPCKEEKCSVQLLGAYIEILECTIPEVCDCSAEWEEDGSTIWAQPQTVTNPNCYTTGTVVKVIPRLGAGPDEFLYFNLIKSASSPRQYGDCNHTEDIKNKFNFDSSCAHVNTRFQFL